MVRAQTDWPTVDAADSARLLEEAKRRFGDGLVVTLTPDSIGWLLGVNARPVDTLAPPAQLDALQSCMETIVQEAIPGDLIEAGCFRGGQCVLMSGVLKALGAMDRKIFAADSFEGLPRPDGNAAPDDALYEHLLNSIGRFRATLEQSRETLNRYELLDDRIHPIPGWFHETLRLAPIESLALIRLDATFHESTRHALDVLYPKLSKDGFLFCADYHVPTGARRAVEEYRLDHGIEESIVEIDGQGVLWRKRNT